MWAGRKGGGAQRWHVAMAGVTSLVVMGCVGHDPTSGAELQVGAVDGDAGADVSEPADEAASEAAASPPADRHGDGSDEDITASRPGCVEPSPVVERDNVVMGTSEDGLDVLAWLYVVPGPDGDRRMVVGVQHKVVWSVGAEGGLALVAHGPSEQIAPPDHGPRKHRHGSSWPHDGAEWGSAFTFDEPGCWELVATVDQREARVLVDVHRDHR